MAIGKKTFKDAQRLMIDGKLNESIEAFTEVIEAGEKNDIVFLSRGVAHLKNRDTDKAIDDFNEVVKMNDDNVRAHYYRGIAYLIKDDYKDAISDFDKTIDLDPNNGPAFFARGTAYAQVGNDELATKNIKTAVTFSEANIYGLQETIGLLRTQFGRVMTVMDDPRKSMKMTLTEEEVSKLKKWLEEGYKKETFH
jgi:tetratricopeptide (TPR) repeat protein